MESLNNSSESNESELQRKMEDDHLRLQRQVRMIQVDRQQRCMGVHPQFRRQDNLLSTLKTEHENLRLDLKMARSGAHKKRDKKMKRDVKKSLLLMEETDIDCEGGVAITEELDGLVQRHKKELVQLKKSAIAFEGELEARRQQGETRLNSAENSLETAMLRFNAVQYQNKKIREEIDDMLKDRVLFNQSWDKMLAALGKGKKFLSDLFESSTLAYDQRDVWVTKLKSIQEKGKMDQMLQVQEMRDLKKAYDHEMKIYLFLAKKGVVRVNLHQQKKDEELVKKAEELTLKEYDKHIAILDEIKDYTEESDYNNIIYEFEQREQQNFSMYTMITDCCAENEVLRRELRDLRQMLMDRRDWNEAQEASRSAKLEVLKKQLEEQNQKVEELRDRLAGENKKITDTMNKVHELFRMADCSLEPFQNLLGDKQPSLHKLNLTMGLLTDKIQELIETVYYFERVLKHRDKNTTSRLKKYLIRMDDRTTFEPCPIIYSDPCPSCIESRWMSRVCDSPEKPFTTTEALSALKELSLDPAYMRSDRVHALTECRATASRRLLATRHFQF